MDFEEIAKRLGGVCPAGGGSFRPMNELEIRSVERQIESILPKTYRCLLARFGAFTFHGRSEDDPFIFFTAIEKLPDHIAANGRAIIRLFYGATQEVGPSGLSQQISIFKGRIPETMIPIAGDGGAGQICLGIKDDDIGRVFYWDMANEPLDEETYIEDFGEPMPAEAKRQNIYIVAESFEDFLDRLVLNPNQD